MALAGAARQTWSAATGVEHRPQRKRQRSMNITKVRTHVLQAALSQPFAYSRAWYDTRTAMLLEIETDDGLIGWGECYGPAAITSAVVKSVTPWLIGEDPLRTDFLWQTVYARLRDHGQKGV